MNTSTTDNDITGLVVIDAYNDFISEGCKNWRRVKAVAEANNCVSNMLEVLSVARKAKLQVFFAMHHRYRPGDFETWKYIAPIQKAQWTRKTFEYWHVGWRVSGRVRARARRNCVQEHWCSSGFANTDLICTAKKTWHS